MRVDWCVSSWFRIKNTDSLTRKYFEHAGALLTADGTDDDLLIKLEGAPAGYKVVIPQLT